MAETAHQTAGTEVPAHQGGGEFPPFETETYPAQIFWLAVTFVVLFVVMWRFGVKGLGGAINARKGQIDGDMSAAEAHRKSAEQASADYEGALAAARNRAQTLAQENHQRIQAEVDEAKAKADREAQEAQAKAEARIAATRAEAKGHVNDAARDAAVAIVARLIGDTVSADDAAKAVGGQ